MVDAQPTPDTASSIEPEEVQKPAKMSRFHKAQREAQRMSEERHKRKEEANKRADDREQAIAKRKRTHKALSRKTRAGQPVMGNKIQHLLSKIQEQK